MRRPYLRAAGPVLNVAVRDIGAASCHVASVHADGSVFVHAMTVVEDSSVELSLVYTVKLADAFERGVSLDVTAAAWMVTVPHRMHTLLEGEEAERPLDELVCSLLSSSASVKNCGHCGKYDRAHSKLCSGCRQVSFCKGCQKPGWKAHKLLCKAVRARAKSEEKLGVDAMEPDTSSDVD